VTDETPPYTPTTAVVSIAFEDWADYLGKPRAQAREEFDRWKARLLADHDAALRAELDRLHSWAGLLELLDEHWPEDIFPTLEDDEERSPGPRLVSLVRWVAKSEAALTTARATIDEALAHELPTPVLLILTAERDAR
jgi:hypothetical protein